MADETDTRNPDGEDDGHDLLTFNEAGAWLSQELRSVEAVLAASEDADERARDDTPRDA